ncbi:TPA: inositol monophosphatase family protein [Streptococcus suis]|uniref:inositol monophosphatase family protein n=1 Tax=Streptococcus suis TaxID=1307 RepID=UPI000CF4061B|nr:inositol monophosphatase family protein [Streptococcus suis]MCK3881261.1 inositol monophosphatase family protein [Streptococcus suis]MCQ8259967.1 inositol monophosphatase family protein [Streptococcus suis]MDW8682393.1 inositol monophosphatase family protein [Streptococcus suis]MDW8759576.1 inositol monophosphatase family protein [Streptococcus suis]NQJ67769.1 inositol monophosphatase family protein [Streptococcus suis]
METKYRLAQSLVLQAGEFLKTHLHDELEIEEKENATDLVTQLDKLTQQFLTNQIKKEYPSDLIFGEEGGDVSSISNGNVWVIDPIDGTSNFIAQKNDFALMLAYFENGIGQFGLIYDVMQDKLFHGGGKFPVFCNKERLASPSLSSISQTLLGLNAQLYAANKHGLADLANISLGTRSVGSAGIGFSHVLEGRLFAYASYLYPWDYAAASILGQGLDLSLLSLEAENPSFDKREHVILVANQHLEEVKRYLF